MALINCLEGGRDIPNQIAACPDYAAVANAVSEPRPNGEQRTKTTPALGIEAVGPADEPFPLLATRAGRSTFRCAMPAHRSNPSLCARARWRFNCLSRADDF
jgi:hypothetical protein